MLLDLPGLPAGVVDFNEAVAAEAVGVDIWTWM